MTKLFCIASNIQTHSFEWIAQGDDSPIKCEESVVTLSAFEIAGMCSQIFKNESSKHD